MLSDATLTADIIKQFAKNAVDSTMPFSFHYGTVKSTDPIEIEVEQKLILTENDLIFTTLVQDFDVDMYMEHTTEKTDLIHNHKATPVVVGTAGSYPFTQQEGVYDHENGVLITPGTYTAIDKTGDEHNHSHEYKGVKTFTVNLKLAKDEKVLLLRIQGGQKFLVLDRVRTLNDTEFTDEFEGSGSSGSSGSGSSSDSGNTSGGGSGGSTDSSGGNSGSIDSGNGGNDSGGSVSNVISVTALMTALLSLTDEQKKEIGLTGVTIDDENVTDSSTWSSQKIQDSVNANTFEISKLNETTELSGECCIPIVQGTETKKIKVDTLQSELNDKINAINEKLPEQATNENELADKDFVNSSISTNTSYFIGTFNSLSELQASNKTITKNDYAFIVETDDVGNVKYNRYKWNGSEWLFEYALNNSSFTSNQWKTINSNITEEWKNSIETDIETEISERKSADTSLQNQINNKANANHTHTSIKRTQTASGTDLNNLITPGEYFAIDNVTYTNAPCNNFTMQVIQLMSSYIFQIVYAYSSNKIYTRSYIYNGVGGKKWTSWKEFISTTDIDTSMNTESTNPVQNKVVTNYINSLSINVTELGTKVTNLGNQISSLGNKVYTCSTASGTKNKTVSIPNIDTPSIGTHITVVFTNGNSIASPTLGINGTSSDEIRMSGEDGTLIPFTTTYGSSTTAPYSWQSNTTLDLYYNGTYWIVLNNPVVKCKKTRTAGTSSSSPSYKVYANGYKEIIGYASLGDVSSKKDINTTFTLPITMSETNYYVSLSTRHNNSSDVQSGEEMTYYGDTTTLKIHFFNRNESTTMKGVYLTWMIQGY